MKGIVLAGGYGTRLYPFTRYMSKHLLPVYDKAMVCYPLQTLRLADITEVLLITTTPDVARYQNLLGDGELWGMHITYMEQPTPQGIASAFLLAENFIGDSSVCLILGDNIFHAKKLRHQLLAIKQVIEDENNIIDAVVLATLTQEPQRYGIVRYDEQRRPIAIIEKPAKPPSNHAVTGLYFYANNVLEIAKNLTPSARGELEITDVNQYYLQQQRLMIEYLKEGAVWFDCGTHTALAEASQFFQQLSAR
ncbi:MAG: glucose-1-phosphate thymidylyltransferase RfbA [Gammaproteobacteria bacterium]